MIILRASPHPHATIRNQSKPPAATTSLIKIPNPTPSCTASPRVKADGDTDSDSETMGRCLSCKEYRGYEDYHEICKACYVADCSTKKELKKEIDNLEAKVAFLRFWSPLDHYITHTSTAGAFFTDVVLVATSDDCLTETAASVHVPAHKAVLVTRSPVFRAMFENEMEESRSGTIKISDVSYDALGNFVNYLYTAEACLDEQMAYDLLVLAEKYQVKHLKADCEKFLVSILNWDNSVVCYTFAHQYNAKHMLEKALSLITDNMDEFTKREEYMELVKKDPWLVVEIYEAYLSKHVNYHDPKPEPVRATQQLHPLLTLL